MLKVFYILIFVCITVFGNSQTIKFDNYTTKNGLLSNEVYNLHQDTKGYIWLFTNYGVMKYNGKSFESVLKNLPFRESFIYCIYENENGRKWVANANSNIYEIKNDSAFLVKGTEEISGELKKNAYSIYQIYVDDSLNMYIISKNGSYKLYKNKGYKGFNISNQKQKDSLRFSAIEFKRGIISSWNINNNEIKNDGRYIYLNGQFLNKNKLIRCFRFKYKSIYYIPKYTKKYNENIYISGYSKIIKIDKNGFLKEIQMNSYILNFAKDKNNHLWVACYNNGLFELDEHDSIVNHYFNNKTINDVLIDSNNGLWVSSEGFGLFHCKDLDVINYKENKILDIPISFIKKVNQRVFIAYTNGAIFLIENSKMVKVHNEDFRLDNEPFDVFEYDSNYYVVFRHGLKKIHLNNTLYDFKLLRKGESSRNMILIGKDSILFSKPDGPIIFYKNEIINKLYINYKCYWCEFRNQNILVATNNGIYQFINNQFVQPKYLLPTKNCVITKIVKDRFNNYWFCSKGSGLFKLSRNNKLKQYTISNDLPSNIVYDVNFTEDNRLLLSTNKGLFYNDGLNDKLKNWKELYDEEVKSALSFNHTIYIATTYGLVTINEKMINSDKSIFINLTSLLLNGIVKDRGELSHLSYDQNNLECNVDIISYSTNIPKMMYELSGAKNQGGITENQHVSFQNLAIGNYTLTLSLYSKEYNVKPIVIEFSITPAYWQTVWFKSLCILAILISCFIIVRIAFRFYKNKEDKKNEANKLIIEYKLIALKAQINPHFMSNCLTAIQHLILSNKVDEANQYLAKFSLLVRQVLNFSSKPLVSLREELEITELNIELEQLRFENKFLFEIELHENINLKNIYVPIIRKSKSTHFEIKKYIF
jgi:ligand-binding sensor domain-containing protein